VLICWQHEGVALTFSRSEPLSTSAVDWFNQDSSIEGCIYADTFNNLQGIF